MAAFGADPDLVIDRIYFTRDRQDWSANLAAIDDLDKQVGGDPFLDSLRSLAYLHLQQPDDALAAARRSVAADPTELERWWFLFDAQMWQGHSQAVATLDEIRKQFPSVPLEDFEQAVRAQTDFVESSEYRAWLDRNKPAP